MPSTEIARTTALARLQPVFELPRAIDFVFMMVEFLPAFLMAELCRRRVLIFGQ